jgi:crotonobetainyl-CoA:carnitine CoA-transferase CaiB-like acyl-CoA transferase
MGPLQGLKVLDLSHVMAGPTCALMLADMGADVIKVEKLPGGDDVRRQVPPKIGDEAASFMMMNRNKRGIALDLKKPGGKRVLEQLVPQVDVLIENFSPGTMDKLGFGYPRLKAINPALIYCTLTGFGRTGPYAQRRGFDLVAQAMSGIMSFTGEGPGRPPVKCGAPLTDITAGILAAMGVLAAYTHRLKTGQGQMVDTSLFEAGIVHTYWQSAIAFATGIGADVDGLGASALGALPGLRDAGWLDGRGRRQPEQLAEAGRGARGARAAEGAALRREPRPHHQSRIAAGGADAVFPQAHDGGWMATFDAIGLPCGPVNDVKQMHADPQAVAREMVIDVDHKTLGKVRTLGLPVKFSDTPGGVRRGAPLLGQHTREVLREFGFADPDIDAFLAEGAVVQP